MGRVIPSVTVAAVFWATTVAYAQSPPPAGTVDVVPAASPSPAPRAGSPTDDSVVLNFEGADIREVIHSLADALGINYQIDPRIQGQVTIRTTGTIAKQDLFPVFNQILRSNGISAVKVGDIYQIIPVAEAKTKAIIPTTPGEVKNARQQDAFVIEDADHLLKPRVDGNEHLHRFLTIADGVVRSQGRKIIFSTNLPNVGDLDDALIRPGRCFARIHVRALSSAEARTLAEEIAAGDAEKLDRAALAVEEGRKCSLAEIYRAVG